MTDRELLELAAKAAGLVALEFNNGQTNCEYAGSLFYMTRSRSHSPWNPLTDDGDALRLAAKLRLDIEHGSPLDNSNYVCVSRCGIAMMRDLVSVVEEFDDEFSRALSIRRAIVLAAAEIGKAIP